MKNKQPISPMHFIANNAILIVPLFPMTVVGIASFFFASRAGIHWTLSLLLAAVAALAIELAGISAFKTMVSVYQSFKLRHNDAFIIVEFAILVLGVLVYLVAIGLSSMVLEQVFKNSWAIGAMAGMLAIAVYVVRAIGETYHKIEHDIELDIEFERRKREQLFEEELKDREQSRKIELKNANVQIYETRTELEHAKLETKTAIPEVKQTASNRGKHSLIVPPGTSQGFKNTFGQYQAERNHINKKSRVEQLLQILSEHPNIGQNAAGRMIGIAAATTSSYVKELMNSGRLAKNGNGWKEIKE